MVDAWEQEMPTGRNGASLDATEGNGKGLCWPLGVSRGTSAMKRWGTTYNRVTFPGREPTRKNRWAARPNQGEKYEPTE